jgi:hypothetical protein
MSSSLCHACLSSIRDAVAVNRNETQVSCTSAWASAS